MKTQFSRTTVPTTSSRSPEPLSGSHNEQGIGDTTSEDRGSGARYNAGKPPLELLPLEALEDIAQVLDHGRRKYAPWNWAKGQSWMANLGCALRHLTAFQKGEDNDPGSGESHLAHAGCCLLFALHFQRHCKDMDDRPRELTKDYHSPAREEDNGHRLRLGQASICCSDPGCPSNNGDKRSGRGRTNETGAISVMDELDKDALAIEMMENEGGPVVYPDGMTRLDRSGGTLAVATCPGCGRTLEERCQCTR